MKQQHPELSMPGRIITFFDMEEFHALESELPRLMYPKRRRRSGDDLWAGRRTLSSLMRPATQSGPYRLQDVEAAVVEEPAKNYLAVLEQATVKFTGGGRHAGAWKSAAIQAAEEYGLGFVVSGVDGVSTSHRVTSTAWYFPYLTPRDGIYINRIVTQPSLVPIAERTELPDVTRIAYGALSKLLV